MMLKLEFSPRVLSMILWVFFGGGGGGGGGDATMETTVLLALLCMPMPCPHLYPSSNLHHRTTQK